MTTPETAPVEVTQAIEPCPFCGSPGEMIHPLGSWSREGYGPNGSRIRCSNLDCSCYANAIYGEDQDQRAITAWNHRLTPRQDGLREALGEALFALSARLKLSGFLGDGDNHAAYEKVVAAFAALSDISPLANEAPMDQLQRLGQEFDAANETGALRELLKRTGSALDDFVRHLGHKNASTGGTHHRWASMPTVDEVQTALQVSNDVAAALASPDDGEGK